MSNIISLKSWKEVTEYIDNGFWQPAPSYFEHIVQHGNYYPHHAFSKGQLASKSWLLKQLWRCSGYEPSNVTIAILGSWIGSIDAESIEKSEKLNQKYVQDNWKYKGVVADVDLLDCSAMEFETGGELITVKPDWIINTSCEHMSTLWFDSVDKDQLIVMQTNNSDEFDGHINPCYTQKEMQTKYPLSETLYVGALETPAYTRYMQIGYK